MSIPQLSSSEQQAIRVGSEKRLRTVFPAGTLVWIVDEHYEAFGPVWRVTLVCPGEMGRWMKRRYNYDIPSDTLHFAGEHPITDSELLAARRDGRRL